MRQKVNGKNCNKIHNTMATYYGADDHIMIKLKHRTECGNRNLWLAIPDVARVMRRRGRTAGPVADHPAVSSSVVVADDEAGTRWRRSQFSCAQQLIDDQTIAQHAANVTRLNATRAAVSMTTTTGAPATCMPFRENHRLYTIVVFLLQYIVGPYRIRMRENSD